MSCRPGKGKNTRSCPETGVSIGEILVKVGPEGSFHGDRWDDGGNGNVKQVYVRHGKVINSIQTVNELNGALVVLEKHGGEGPNFNMITLRESEYIISLSGFSDFVDGETVISSIKISTNSAEYGPYGSKKEIKLRSAFKFEVVAGKFGGFHGYSGSKCMYAIGIYVNTKAHSALGPGASNLPRLPAPPPTANLQGRTYLKSYNVVGLKSNVLLGVPEMPIKVAVTKATAGMMGA
ncbi:hypothetical protein NE237_011791 [Protea cynaroides]|uniref:Jacalin-type lectin domain-containing protein n=1 Tax=Protea cynaroides TaxID=273540 RepID=A0A9Q0JYN9_9MAGN|nr:hypothetical protein NE237_011791 [Protea cynaroides]